MTLQLVRPHRGPITQWYGNPQPDGLPHAGQDYGYTDGKNVFPEVYAAAAGTVIFAGDSRSLGWPNEFYVNPDFDRSDAVDTSAGNLVCIAHDGGAVTGYAHLESWSVRKGQTVRARQQIGITGNTGYSFGRHLHFFLMFKPYNYGTLTYGCSDPNPYFTGTLSPASTTTTPQEAPLTAKEVEAIQKHQTAEANRVINYIGDVLVEGYRIGKQEFPGMSKVEIQNQRELRGLKALVAKALERPDLTAEDITAAVEKGIENGSVTVTIEAGGPANG